MKKIGLAFPAFLFFCLISIPDTLAQLTVSGEIRPRTEYRHGFKTLPAKGADPAFFTEQRSRLNVLYREQIFRVGLSVQDVRIWGSVDQANKTDNFASVHEAWGELSITPKLSLKAGRQELVYDDHRIFGNLDWLAQARSHDALKLVYTDSLWSFHAGAAYNQDNRVPEPNKLFGTAYDPTLNNYKTLQYVWFGRQSPLLDFSVLALNDGKATAAGKTNFVQTVGLNPTLKLGAARLFGSAYFQTGRNKANQNVSAYLLSANASYPIRQTLTATLGLDYLSGSTPAQLAAGKSHTFDPLYGTHHKFYGLMDYFYVGSPHGPGGLRDVYLKVTQKFSPRVTLMADLHHFSSAASVPHPESSQGNLPAAFGAELDLVCRYAIAPSVSFTGGYSHLFGTTTLQTVKPGGGSKDATSNWAWAMLSFNPVFFAGK